ncbi:hypothetical protein [Ktedonobacter robiniae]|uniref:Bacterial spore germination immunoglobulin-like domain-containing protein n=1 Tax=Ktedonobacter robiniae TaxID=2778365 RepID=A0ABQ3UK50_9CHLR|nr:hypothetical protein [Ktedonobacter robiniae]GHO53042.1 hypothetical protein KSB_15170 [Ktedonobacter robiniae]
MNDFPQMPPSPTPSQDKLILPAQPAEPELATIAEGQQTSPQGAAASYANYAPLPQNLAGPAPLVHYTPIPPVPRGPIASLGYYWQKDPAYRFLLLSIAFVLLASTAFAIVLGNYLTQGTGNSPSPNQAQGPGLHGNPTATAHPQVTATPAPQPSPSPTPTQQPTQEPTDTPDPTQPTTGQLSVQIINAPAVVNNGSSVQITVASQPGATVRLSVRYQAAPFVGGGATTLVGDSGTTQLRWNVRVISSQDTSAQLTIIATDQNGQSTQSAPVTVQINVK